jgi:hypothetical protein
MGERYRGPVKIVDRPRSYPGHTVWGRTAGPVAYLGDVELPGGAESGIGVFIDEREMMQLTLAWRWPTPQERDELQERVKELEFELASVRAELEEALESQVQVVPVRELAGVMAAARRDSPTPAEPTAA